MATYNEYIAAVRSNIEEASAVQWTNDDLTMWIDEAAREISLAARNLRDEWSVAFAAGDATKDAASGLIISIDDAWWKFDSAEIRYPLEIRNHRDMHSRWGLYRDIRQGIPVYLTASKTSTTGVGASSATLMQLRLYPIPQAAGTLYYQGVRAATTKGIGATAVTGSHIVECEAGWEYLIVKYATAKALIRGQDVQKGSMMLAEYMDGLKLLASFADESHLPGAREFVPQYFGNAWQGYGYGANYYDDW